MEKTFTKAILLSATVFTAFMIVVPIGHLSAQNEIKIDEGVKFHKATVSNVDFTTNTIIIVLDGASVPVVTNASTTVFFPNGDETALPSVQNGSEIYVFGNYNAETRVINADKIVLRNRSVLRRKTLSRVELHNGEHTTVSPLAGEITLGNK